jgi:hypothetical protein
MMPTRRSVLEFMKCSAARRRVELIDRPPAAEASIEL